MCVCLWYWNGPSPSGDGQAGRGLARARGSSRQVVYGTMRKQDQKKKSICSSNKPGGGTRCSFCFESGSIDWFTPSICCMDAKSEGTGSIVLGQTHAPVSYSSLTDEPVLARLGCFYPRAFGKGLGWFGRRNSVPRPWARPRWAEFDRATTRFALWIRDAALFIHHISGHTTT